MRGSQAALFVVAMIVAGAAVAQTTVTGTLTGSPTPAVVGTMDFGTQPVGTAGAPQTETITAHLVAVPPPVPLGTVIQIQSVASNSGEFQVTGSTCPAGTLLADGQTCDVQLAFTPAAVGPRSGALSVQCSVTAAVGVIAFVCDGVVRQFMLMSGLGAVRAAIPTLGREALTALALLLMLASFYWLRRRR
ncbi:MAG TPA: hypothetical protein VLU54_09425 [Casimicrobiaceae bacterium]|nr:hypothetical protein [Casimicrobiaceae bacterium]